MNIIQIQDDLKGLPDQELISEVQNPSGVAPVYLLLGELQRREKMRAEFAGKQEPTQTVAEQIIEEAIAPAPPMPIEGSPVPPGPGQAIPPAGEVVDVNRMNEVVTPQGAEMTDTNMLASRGVGALPAPNVGQYAEGGVVGFDNGGMFGKGIEEAQRRGIIEAVRPESQTAENYSTRSRPQGLGGLAFMIKNKEGSPYRGFFKDAFGSHKYDRPGQSRLMKLIGNLGLFDQMEDQYMSKHGFDYPEYAQGGVVGFAPGGPVADPYNLPYEELNKDTYFGSGQQLGDDYWSLPVMEVVGEQHQEDIGTRGELYTDDSVTVEQDLNPLPIGDQITRQHLTNIEGDEYLGEGEGGLFDSDTLGYGMSKEESIEKLENDPRYKPYLTPAEGEIDPSVYAWEGAGINPETIDNVIGWGEELYDKMPKADLGWGQTALDEAAKKQGFGVDDKKDKLPSGIDPDPDAKHWEDVAEKMNINKGQYQKLIEGQIASGGKSSFGDDKTLKDRTAEIEKMMHDMGIYDSKEDERAAKVADRIEREEARSAWNAVTMAGLSMMQGDSQFALTNIGKGIEDGISAYEKSEQKIADLEDKKLELAEKKATRDRDKKIAALTMAIEIEKSNAANLTSLLTAQADLESKANIANANNLTKQWVANKNYDARVKASIISSGKTIYPQWEVMWDAAYKDHPKGTPEYQEDKNDAWLRVLQNIEGKEVTLPTDEFSLLPNQ